MDNGSNGIWSSHSLYANLKRKEKSPKKFLAQNARYEMISLDSGGSSLTGCRWHFVRAVDCTANSSIVQWISTGYYPVEDLRRKFTAHRSAICSALCWTERRNSSSDCKRENTGAQRVSGTHSVEQWNINAHAAIKRRWIARWIARWKFK